MYLYLRLFLILSPRNGTEKRLNSSNWYPNKSQQRILSPAMHQCTWFTNLTSVLNLVIFHPSNYFNFNSIGPFILSLYTRIHFHVKYNNLSEMSIAPTTEKGLPEMLWDSTMQPAQRELAIARRYADPSSKAENQHACRNVLLLLRKQLRVHRLHPHNISQTEEHYQNCVKILNRYKICCIVSNHGFIKFKINLFQVSSSIFKLLIIRILLYFVNYESTSTYFYSTYALYFKLNI